MPAERLQKILARAGLASRRKAEEYILAGRVTVNGKPVLQLGAKADPERDHIKVDGKLIRLPRQYVYLALNKPKECVTTLWDPQGRRTVRDLIKGVPERVYPVGRLDYHSEGLLLLTNDGDFTARILSPASKIPKTYLVKVNGPLTPEQEEEFRQGIPLYGRRTAPAQLRLVRRARNPWYSVTLVEGRQNQIRLMFRHFGRLVEKLKRVRIGFLELGSLKPGAYRLLTPAEVARFRKLLGLAGADSGKPSEHRHGA
jgi:pseudouridine synthase